MEPLYITRIEALPGVDGISKTQGTIVHLSNGARLAGVTKIVLVAVPNDVWRAEIQVNVPPDNIVALAKIYPSDEKLDFDATSLPA